jgi:hypothetical protein
MSDPKVLVVECPICQTKMAVNHIDDLSEIVGCQLGCSGCGKVLFCQLPGRLVLFSEYHHEVTGTLPTE